MSDVAVKSMFNRVQSNCNVGPRKLNSSAARCALRAAALRELSAVRPALSVPVPGPGRRSLPTVCVCARRT
jgi:hypothetical protein